MTAHDRVGHLDHAARLDGNERVRYMRRIIMNDGEKAESRVDAILGPSSPLAKRLAGYEQRDGQLAMARAVEHALANDGHLFVEAGTGTGKTLAYLIPAILSGRKVVIATATRALQDQIFTKDLPLVREVLAEHGVTFQAALMKGLSNYVCKRRLSERLRSGEPVFGDLARIERWSHATLDGDRAELVDLDENSQAFQEINASTDTRIGAGCTYFEECFVTRMRREAEQAQVIVVNHHLFFADLALRTSKSGGHAFAIPNYDAVIFDEAHQIENVATEFFGVRVSTTRLAALVRDAERALRALGPQTLDATWNANWKQATGQLEEAAHLFFDAWLYPARGIEPVRPAGEERAASGAELGKRLLVAHDWTTERHEALVRLDASLEVFAALALQKSSEEAVTVLARRAGDVRADLARLKATATPAPSATASATSTWTIESDDAVTEALTAASPEGFNNGVLWLDTRWRSVALGASPVDVGPLLRESLFQRVASVVCTSATLATASSVGPSFHFARSRLGARFDTVDLVVPSPFDFASRSALYVADDLPEPMAAGFDEASAARIAELVAITGGGAFVLCTSNRAMRALCSGLQGRVPGPLLMQGEASKREILRRFKDSGDAVLVATMSFWEGVDVPGHALRLVVIDKIPFAVPSEPVVAARSARIEAEGGNAFSQYALPSAAIALKQGFGRLIRTRSDAGIVAILDPRIAHKGYGKRLLASLPKAQRVRSLGEVRAFWHSLDAVPES